MSHDDDERLAERLDPGLRRALGGLFPQTEREVAEAEADAVEFRGELPPALREPPTGAARLRRAEVVPIERARKPSVPRAGQPGLGVLSHLVAGMLGAAAMLALYLASPRPQGPSAAAEPTLPSASGSAAAPTRIAIDVPACSESCCGGSDCAKQRQECPSGRACVECDPAPLGRGAYRMRFSGLVPGEALKKTLEQGPLELCARVGASERRCAPAFLAADSPQRYSEIPLPVAAGDVVAGVDFSVRFQGAKESLFSWVETLTVSPALLCKGSLVSPKSKDGEVLGTFSLFLADSHYVELGRAADVAALERAREHFETPLPFFVFETRAEQPERRFVLTLGPFGAGHAERVRWAVLEAGGQATTSAGSEFVGAPRPVR